MAKKDYFNIGDDIKSIIKDAINSAEFREVNKNIKKTVNRALEEVREGSHNWQQMKNSNERNKETPDEKQKTPEKKRPETRPGVNKEYKKQFIGFERKKPERILITKSPPGRVSGILLMVFGSIGIGLTFVFFLAMLLISNFAYESLPLLLGAILPMLLLNFFMVAKGSGLRRRVNRFYHYVKKINNRSYCEIKELADQIGRSNKYVVKDLQKMIRLGMFPEGRIDEKKTYLLISDEAYEAHTKMEKSRRIQEELERDRIEIDQRKKMMDEQNPQMKAVHEVIDEGKETIRQIKEANAAILGDGISKKLDRLENVIRKIFAYIEENPEEVPEIRKFMGYYLPTTLKLVRVYQDIDGELIQGPNIIATKKEIEETMDTINYAFENLLDSFYEDTALDVSTDISVLNTILAQEGLTKRDFKNKGDTDNG